MLLKETTSVRDVSGLSAEELEDGVAEWAAHMSAGMCRWLELVGELDSRGADGLGGPESTAAWLAWRCALLPRSAREHVRVARRLRELPLIHAAFACGELSYAKVRGLSAYRRVSTEEAADLHEREYLSTYWDEDGSLVLSGRLAPEEGARFLRGLEAARDPLWKQARHPGDGSAEPLVPGRRPTGSEALAALAELALGAGEAAGRGGERYQVLVHVDESVLERDGEGGCVLDDGPALAPETARRLACDASLVRVQERDGELLDVGRKTRKIPAALRRALHARDQGCRFPGCTNRRFVDAHHIQHWAHGGHTKQENLILLCRRHHRLVHEGGYTLETHPGGDVRFRHPWGQRIPAVPRPPTGIRETLEGRNIADGLAIDPNTCQSGSGEQMDLAAVVDALIDSLG